MKTRKDQSTFRRKHGHPGLRRRRAFTLIELMMVLALIGVLTGVIVAEMRGTYESVLLRASAREIIGILELAHSRAIASNQPHFVRIDPGESRYAIMTRTQPPDLEAAPDPSESATAAGGSDGIFEEGKLDRRIAIELKEVSGGSAEAVEEEAPEEAAGEQERARAAGPSGITFFPDGTALPMEILLKDREGVELLLRIHPITSRVRTVRPGEEEAPREAARGSNG